jgi:hypothetical protein
VISFSRVSLSSVEPGTRRPHLPIFGSSCPLPPPLTCHFHVSETCSRSLQLQSGAVVRSCAHGSVRRAGSMPTGGYAAPKPSAAHIVLFQDRYLPAVSKNDTDSVSTPTANLSLPPRRTGPRVATALSCFFMKSKCYT